MTSSDPPKLDGANQDALQRRWEPWMKEAIAWAKLASQAGDVPIGALVVLDGQIIGRGYNVREHGHDPSGHAEIVALREACRRVQRWRLDGATLVVTLEPCVMCAGALVNARVSRLVYGAQDPKAGGIDSLYKIGKDPRLNHRFEVISGVLPDACAQLLRDFFSQARRHRTRSQSPRVLRGYEHTAQGRAKSRKPD